MDPSVEIDFHTELFSNPVRFIYTYRMHVNKIYI